MKTFIFDLDGTLLNTIEDIGNACNSMLQNHGWPTHSIESYKHKIGNGFARLVSRSLPEEIGRNATPAELNNFIDEAKSNYASGMTERTLPYKGMQKTLRFLMEQNISMGILSNKPDELTRKLAKFFFPEIKFLFVQGAIPEFPHKPDPALLNNLIKSYNIADSIYYVGDSKVDIALARNAHIVSIGVTWGFRGLEELKTEKADYIIETPEDLLKI